MGGVGKKNLQIMLQILVLVNGWILVYFIKLEIIGFFIDIFARKGKYSFGYIEVKVL